MQAAQAAGSNPYGLIPALQQGGIIDVETFIDGNSVGRGRVAMKAGPLGALAFTLNKRAQQSATLRAGDVISEVEGVATDDLSLDEVVKRLKGPKGTTVHIKIKRIGMKEPIPLTITRAARTCGAALTPATPTTTWT